MKSISISISIIVPVYNSEKTILNCIRSIQNQDFHDIEIIIIDDGSTDDSACICDELKESDPRINVIHKANEGVSKARNTGIQLAKGTYIAFVDSDDYLPQGAYKKLILATNNEAAEVVIGDVYQVTDHEKKYVRLFKNNFITTDKNVIRQVAKTTLYKRYCPYIPDAGIGVGYGGPWNKLFKRDYVISHGFVFDESVRGIFDDVIFCAYAIANATVVAYTASPVYYYRINAESLTRRYKKNVLEINDRIFESLKRFSDKLDPSDFRETICATMIWRFAEYIDVELFHENNENDFCYKIRELRRVLRRAQYHNASKYVDLRRLSPYHKLLYVALKYRSAALIVIGFYFRKLIKTICSKR